MLVVLGCCDYGQLVLFLKLYIEYSSHDLKDFLTFKKKRQELDFHLLAAYLLFVFYLL